MGKIFLRIMQGYKLCYQYKFYVDFGEGILANGKYEKQLIHIFLKLDKKVILCDNQELQWKLKEVIFSACRRVGNNQ